MWCWVISFDFDFSLVGAFASGLGELTSHPQCYVAIFSLLFVDFFDTAGTLVAVCNRANLVDETGNLENVDRALLADSIGTVIGSIAGTSTVTSFVESTSGVEVGGRTGLTAVTTGVCFLLSVFFSPLLSCVTSAVTAPALIIVGILMAQQLNGIILFMQQVDSWQLFLWSWLILFQMVLLLDLLHIPFLWLVLVKLKKLSQSYGS